MWHAQGARHIQAHEFRAFVIAVACKVVWLHKVCRCQVLAGIEATKTFA